jgi:hypothetical protein
MWNIMPQRLKNKVLDTCTFVGELIATSVAINKSRHPSVVYADDGAIDPSVDLAILTKGSAGAYTLAAPTTAQDGHIIRIVSASAYAHVVTSTDLIEDGVTGGPKDKGTFGAFKGASIELVAYNQLWHVLAKNVVTVAAV